jgi:UDP-3-O-[3-hydroxymyristoyl] glucosamine N-acyltransferase
MADSRFHTRAGAISVGQLAEATKLFALPDGADASEMIADVAPLEIAGPTDLSFLENRKYLSAMKASKAGFCVMLPEFAEQAPEGMVPLATPHPYLAYAMIAQALYPAPLSSGTIHPAAYVDPDAIIGEGVEIGANAVVEAGATIGSGTVLSANVTISKNVSVGSDCRIGANASLETCEVGDRVNIQAGARVGMAGFGFAPHPERHRTVPQLGRVLIGSDCHIGANTCIARGSGHDTTIGNNVWIDNMAQIAHNVEVGDGSILVAQVGIAGSAKLGRFVQMGGQSGVSGHVKVGDQVRIGAKSGVMGDVDAGSTIIGLPAIPEKEFWRQLIALKRLGSKKGSGK